MVLDFMDAYFQLLLAQTWQRAQNDSLERLVVLRDTVVERVAAFPDVFDSDRERHIAVQQIMVALQKQQKRPGTDPASRLSHRWTHFPAAASDLQRLSDGAEAVLVQSIDTLIDIARDEVKAGADRHLAPWIESEIGHLAIMHRLPLFIPALADLIMVHALASEKVAHADLTDHLRRYHQRVRQIYIADQKRLVRANIVAEMRWVASGIDLHIGASFAWDDLAFFNRESSLRAVRLYAQMCKQELITDALFVYPEAVIPVDSDKFSRLLDPGTIRGMTFLMTGQDDKLRALRRNIIDTDRTDVRVEGKRVRGKFMVAVPRYEPGFDLEAQLALLLTYLDKERRKRERQGEHMITFFDNFSPALRQLVEHGHLRRKIIRDKKNLMFCLANLVCENIHTNARRHWITLYHKKRVKSLDDARELTVISLAGFGFRYSVESLRDRRAEFMRDYLERVPDIFGLNSDTQPQT